MLNHSKRFWITFVLAAFLVMVMVIQNVLVDDSDDKTRTIVAITFGVTYGVILSLLLIIPFLGTGRHPPSKPRRFSIGISLVVLVMLAAGLELLTRSIYYQRRAGDPLAVVSAARAMIRSLRTPDVEALPQSGRWIRIRARDNHANLTPEQLRKIEELESMAYASGSQLAPASVNVTVHDPQRTQPGLNLVVSGHAPQAILMDHEGRVLHQWACDAFRAWPTPMPDHVKTAQHTYWRRAHLLPNGDLLAIFEGLGIIRLDKDSNLIWAVANNAHHDVHVGQNGNIYLLTRTAHIVKRIREEDPIMEDFIVVLDPGGNELSRISLLKAMEDSPFAPMLNRLPNGGDIFHANTIELIEPKLGRDLSPFRAGTILVSMRHLDLISAVDLESQTIYWATAGMWHRQHQPTLLDNGNILVFDNEGAHSESTVLEIDPVTREIHWSYRGTAEEPFYTPTCGSNQRLPDGNTLITESDSGRAFEVAPDGTIVWQYVNPYRAGDDNQLIATLFEVVRLPVDFPLDWLTRPPNNGLPKP